MKMIIGGKHVDSASGAVIEVINPVTGEVVDTVPSATAQEVEQTLDYAVEGKKIWGSVPFEDRYAILCKAADALLEAKEELAKALVLETGKIYPNALGEVDTAAALFRGYAEKMRHTYQEVLPHDTDMVIIRRYPLGVVACIVPFNFPIELYAQKVASALAMGNAVVVKPSSETPLANILMTDVIIKAGVDPKALQIITGPGASVGRQLSASPKVDAISLTGSSEAGVDVCRNAAGHMARVCMELGGNDAMVVLDDADLDLAVQNAMNGRLLNSGQVCGASKRFVVQNSVKEAFTQKLVARLQEVVIGDPFDPKTEMGSMISQKAAEKVEKQIELTVSQGAKCVLGGKRFGRAFFQPTVLADVSRDMDIAKDMEVFGPVFPIIGFDTDEEAVDIVNQSVYGLSGGVVGTDIQRAFKVADQIDSGGTVVGGTGCYRNLNMPFGGHKMSGIGGEGFSVTLNEMSKIKSLVIKGLIK